MYVFIEALQSTFLAGGSVMLPIILTGVIGFYYLYSTWMRIGGDAFRKDVYKIVEMLRNDLNTRAEDPLRFASKHLGLRGGIVSRELRLALNVAKDTPEKSFMARAIVDFPTPLFPKKKFTKVEPEKATRFSLSKRKR